MKKNLLKIFTTAILIFIFQSNIFAVGYEITFSVVNGNGTLTAISDGSPITSGAYVHPGSVLIFSATPALGFHVSEWKLNGNTVNTSNVNVYQISGANENCNVTVEFAQSAKIIFIIDDSQVKSLPGATLIGTWDRYGNYNNVVKDVPTDYFNDSGADDDATAGDNIWTATKYLIPDGGINTWGWNYNIVSSGKTNTNFEFHVNDASPQTLTHTIVVMNELHSNIMLSPNPADNYINISANDNYNIEIINVNGKVVNSSVMTDNLSTIDISNYQKGMYFVRLSNDKGFSTYKFIKK